MSENLLANSRDFITLLRDRSQTELRVKYANALRKIVDRRMPQNKAGTPLTTDIDLLLAFPQEILEAIESIRK